MQLEILHSDDRRSLVLCIDVGVVCVRRTIHTEMKSIELIKRLFRPCLHVLYANCTSNRSLISNEKCRTVNGALHKMLLPEWTINFIDGQWALHSASKLSKGKRRMQFGARQENEIDAN